MSQMKLPPRSDSLLKKEPTPLRKERPDSSEVDDASEMLASKSSARSKLQQRAQTSRSLSGVHKVVSAVPVQSNAYGIKNGSPTSRSVSDPSDTPAQDDDWNWEAPPAESELSAEPSTAAQRGRRASDQDHPAREKPRVQGTDLFDEEARTLAMESSRLSKKKVSSTRSNEDAPPPENTERPRLRRASRQELEPVRSERPSRFQGNSEPGPRKKERLAQSSTQELDAPDYDDEVDSGGRTLSIPADGLPIFSTPARASTEEIDEGRVKFSRKATPPLELSAVSPRGADKTHEPLSRKATPPLGLSTTASTRASTEEIDEERVKLSRKATPPLELSAVSPRAATQAIDDSRYAASLASAPAEDLFSPREATNALPLETLNKDEEGISFVIPENASIGVIIWTLVKQAIFTVAFALKRVFSPLRDQLDRKIQRSMVINEHENAALTVQQQRVYKIAIAAVVLGVVGAGVWMALSFTREKLPPDGIVKLLYPYGFVDGTLNGRPIAGLQNVDIEYVQREPCLEYETDPHCYAYVYTAKNIEGFTGKMLIGVNHQGQWQLFNPPKEVVAAVQAKTNKKKRR